MILIIPMILNINSTNNTASLREERNELQHKLEWKEVQWKDTYGQFSEFHVCFCGLDPGNLNFEIVRTNKQHICFYNLRRSI